jgi:hypothetical protein
MMEASKEEVSLEEKLAGLRIRLESGEGDADSEDVNAAGEMMTITQAVAVLEAQLCELVKAREAASSCAL